MTQIENTTPTEYLPLFWLKSRRSVLHGWTHSSIEHMCASEPLAHSQVDSHCGCMKGNVIRLKMINAPICQSRHLEPICSTGAWTDMPQTSGIKLLFILSAEAPGEIFLQPAQPPHPPPPRVAQPGPTSELSAFSGGDIYDVELECYLLSTQTDQSSTPHLFLKKYKSVSL